MTTTLQRPATTSDVAERQTPPRELTRFHDQDLHPHVEGSLEALDRVADRRRRAERLAVAADGNRDRLEALRALFLRRLHRTPGSDFDAVEGLRTVEVALSMTPRPPWLWTSHRLEPDQQRRRWRRRRRVKSR